MLQTILCYDCRFKLVLACYEMCGLVLHFLKIGMHTL